MTDRQQAADVLNGAADLIEERGWWQQSGGGTGTCVSNAICEVQGAYETRAAHLAFLGHIGASSLQDIFDWNDATDRTASEVIEVLRAAAAIEQAKHDAANQPEVVIPLFDGSTLYHLPDDSWEIETPGIGRYQLVGPDVAPGVAGNGRPHVSIDPEDREQVERLTHTFYEVRGLGDPQLARDRIDNMQAALRSLLAPEKPTEPLGLGAVVEAANGDLWVRLDTSGVWACASDEHKTATYWPTIAAVKVLSEGVTTNE